MDFQMDKLMSANNNNGMCKTVVGIAEGMRQENEWRIRTYIS